MQMGIEQMKAKRKHNSSLLTGVALSILLGAALTACNRPGAQTKPAEKKAEESAIGETKTSVRTVKAVTGALKTSRSSSGTLEASIDSSIAAQASGQVVNVFFREGARVAAGAVILQLDDLSLRQQLTDSQLALKTAQINLESGKRKTPETLGTNQSSLESARSSLSKAQSTFNSAKSLYDIGGTSQTDLDNAKAGLAQAQANFKQAQASLAQSERSGGESIALLQVAVEQASNRIAQTQRSLNQTRIRAPFAGEVAELNTEVGEFVNTGSKVFRLVDTSSLRAKFRVPSQDANNLQTGAGINIRSGAKRLEGRIVRSTQVAGTNRLVDLYARFISPCRVPGKPAGCQDTSSLTAGGTVQISYNLKLASGTIVPTGALSTASGQPYLYVVKDGIAKQRNVNILAESQGKVALSGLENGETVIFPVPGSLQPGESVNIVATK
jgi:HlyD family secretion protein